jgi:hypothetical protein
MLLLAGYYKLFYKIWSNKTVARNADCIVALDVKRVTNTIIWNILTTPSQWNKISFFSSGKKGKLSWDDMVKLPDYIFVFHPANQPSNAWYTVLEINDKDDFAKGLQQYQFIKRGSNEYYSTALGIEFIQHGNQLLVGNLAVVNKQYIQQLADELLVKKQCIANDQLEQNIKAASHLSVQLIKNNWLQEDHIVNMNFDKESIMIDAAVTPYHSVNLVSLNFSYSDSSLCTLAFTQPQPDIKILLHDSVRKRISTAVNFDIDSVLLQSNQAYQLDIEGIHSRIDSAISYTYDDNFNPVEKAVVNVVEEPALHFSVLGDSIRTIYNYWSNAAKLEKTANGDWFTPLPFAKSYCTVNSEKQLIVSTANFKTSQPQHNEECIFLLQLLLTKIPASYMKYLPDQLIKATANIESVKAVVKNEKGQLVLHVRLNKKKNDLPIIEW